MKWITRERPKIDRIACPWLIKNFVDKDAEFIYVPREKVFESAQAMNAVPYEFLKCKSRLPSRIGQVSKRNRKSPYVISILESKSNNYIGFMETADQLVAKMKRLMETVNYEGLRELLLKNPSLANEGIPFDEKNPAKAHPLHRICDSVFFGAFTDQQGVEMAKIFLAAGARINGNEMIEQKDTPLVAASSLHADEVALFYIEEGANIHHAGCSGGTALHWAAWCGRDKVVRKLIQAGADIHKKCIEFRSTPLLWAVHGYKYGGGQNRLHQIACARMLIKAGADKNTANIEGTKLIDFLDKGDTEFIELFN